MKDKVQKILDEAYRFICNRLEEEGIKHDSQTTDDCIFFDDTTERKTYAINLVVNECAEYEGE